MKNFLKKSIKLLVLSFLILIILLGYFFYWYNHSYKPFYVTRPQLKSQISYVLTKIYTLKFAVGEYPLQLHRNYDFGTFRPLEYKYSSNGRSFKLFIIFHYCVPGSDKHTAVKIIPHSVFWRDDFVEDGQKIKDVDWKKVDHHCCEIKLDENGRYRELTDPDFPDNDQLPFYYNLYTIFLDSIYDFKINT